MVFLFFLPLSLREQKSDFDKAQLLICSCMDHASKSLSNSESQWFSYIFFCTCKIVLNFTFRPMVHFDLIFIYGVRSISKLIFYLREFSCSALLLEKTVLSPLNCICTIGEDQLFTYVWVYFCSIDLLYYLYINITLFSLF